MSLTGLLFYGERLSKTVELISLHYFKVYLDASPISPAGLQHKQYIFMLPNGLAYWRRRYIVALFVRNVITSTVEVMTPLETSLLLLPSLA